jgi:hypothetical protein
MQLAAMPQALADVQDAQASWREAVTRAERAARDAERAAEEGKDAAQRMAAQARMDAREAQSRLDGVLAPVMPSAGEAIASSLEPYAPDLSAVADATRLRLVPTLRDLHEACVSGDAATTARTAGDVRQAIDAAQRQLAQAQDALTDRDPLVAARWFARAAAEALNHRPPDLQGAAKHQHNAATALSRAWDQSIHQAAARRLAGLPSLRAIFTESPDKSVSSAHGSSAAKSRIPASANGIDSFGAVLHDADPPAYEAALKVYFDAISKAREPAR